MINVDEDWPKWAGPKKKFTDYYAVHMLDRSGKVSCGAQAANLYTGDTKKVSCKRCTRSM